MEYNEGAYRPSSKGEALTICLSAGMRHKHKRTENLSALFCCCLMLAVATVISLHTSRPIRFVRSSCATYIPLEDKIAHAGCDEPPCKHS